MVMAAFLGLVGLVAVTQSLGLGPGWGPSGPQPGLLPFILGVALMITTVAVILQTAAAGATGTLFEQRAEVIEVLRVGLPIAAGVFAVRFLGFYLMVALYAGGFIIWHGGYRWYKVIPAVAVFTFVLWRALEEVFRVFMPKSMFYGDFFPL